MADAFTSETYNALCRDAEGYLARGLAEQARELLLKATSLIGTRPRARSLLADSCMQLGLWGEAKSQLEALASLEVDNIYTHFRLGQVLEETGELQLARDNFRVVLDMNPDHHGAKVALTRLEKSISDQTPSMPAPPREGSQIFADENETESVFAQESSDGLDELFSTIGIGEKKDVPGVDDLLDSIGLKEDKKKEKQQQKVDFSSIFGGGMSGKTGDDGEKNESPLASVFGTADSGGSKIPESDADLNAIFGGAPPAEEPEPSEKETAEEPSEEPAAPVEEAEEKPEADLSAIFGGAPPAVEPEPSEKETAEEPAEEPAAPVEEAEEKPEADLSAIFGGAPPAVEPEPSVEETAEEPSEEPIAPVEEAEEKPEADLNAIFGGAPPAVEPEPPEKETAQEPSEEPAAPVEEPEEKTLSDIDAIFGGVPPAVEPSEKETAEEPSEEPAAPVEEPATEIAVEVPVVPEKEEAGETETDQRIVSEKVPPDAEELSTDEATETDEAEKTVDEPAEQVEVVEQVSYDLLPGDSSSLCVMNLRSGKVRVLRGLVAAMAGEVQLEETILSGSGMVWMGQGSLMPVITDYADGMTVRIDRLAARPLHLKSTSAGIEAVPALRRLNGENSGSLLMFISGRLKKITVVPGLRVKAGSVLAADPGVSFSQEDKDFLAVSGSGRVILTG